MMQISWTPTPRGYLRLLAVWLGICVILLSVLWQVSVRLPAPYQVYRPAEQNLQETEK